uniref:Secreted protein n=1 Tax=Micrurus spixii TaxID=129469 RepID=A0A2D4LEZ2_9SAUR
MEQMRFSCGCFLLFLDLFDLCHTTTEEACIKDPVMLDLELFIPPFQHSGVVLKGSCLVGNLRQICYSKNVKRLKEKRTCIYLLMKLLIWYYEYSVIIPEPEVAS